MNADKEGGLGPKLIFTALVILGTIVAIVLEVRSRAPDGETCRMMLPAAYYETPEANSAAAFRGNIRPPVLAEAYVQTFESNINKLAPNLEENHLPALNDPALLERLRARFSTIRVMEPPPCAWRWDSVIEAVGQFDGEISIVTPWSFDNDQFQNVAMAYSGVPPRLIVNPELVNGMDNSEIDAILIHEATHVVFETIAMETAGYNHRQLRAAQILCGDFDAQMVHIHEGLATWNELRSYVASPIDAKVSKNIGGDAIRAIHEFDREHPKAFTDVMARNLVIRAALFGTGKGLSSKCNFPPIFEGANEGRAFIPNGIDDPLVTTIGLASRLLL